MPVYRQEIIQVSAAATGATNWVPLNIHQTPFNVSFGVLTTGAFDATYRVEHTFDNVLADSSAGSVFTHADVSAASISRDGNYAFPVRAIRLNLVTIASGTGTLKFSVIQSGV